MVLARYQNPCAPRDSAGMWHQIIITGKISQLGFHEGVIGKRWWILKLVTNSGISVPWWPPPCLRVTAATRAIIDIQLGKILQAGLLGGLPGKFQETLGLLVIAVISGAGKGLNLAVIQKRGKVIELSLIMVHQSPRDRCKILLFQVQKRVIGVAAVPVFPLVKQFGIAFKGVGAGLGNGIKNHAGKTTVLGRAPIPLMEISSTTL